MSPTTSLPTMEMPRCVASLLTVSKTRKMEVRSKSVRLIDTWARFRAFSSTPIALTQGIPPLEKRIFLAISLATFTSGVVRVVVVAVRDFPGPAPSGAAAGGGGVGIGRRFLAKALELAPADVFQVHPVGPRGRFFVEVDGNPEAFPDLLADVAGQRDALFDGHALDGDEGDGVGGADAGMRALVLGEINQFG